MFASSEVIIKTVQSKTCFRLILSFYFMSCAWVLCLPSYAWFKCFIVLALTFYLKISPYSGIKQFRLARDVCSVAFEDGKELKAKFIEVLIHNVLFVLIRLELDDQNKLALLFCDQLSQDELRLLCIRWGMLTKVNNAPPPNKT